MFVLLACLIEDRTGPSPSFNAGGPAPERNVPPEGLPNPPEDWSNARFFPETLDAILQNLWINRDGPSRSEGGPPPIAARLLRTIEGEGVDQTGHEDFADVVGNEEHNLTWVHSFLGNLASSEFEHQGPDPRRSRSSAAAIPTGSGWHQPWRGVTLTVADRAIAPIIGSR